MEKFLTLTQVLFFCFASSFIFSIVFCEIDESSRTSRFFPFFLGPTYLRFPNDPCTGDNGLKGTCYSRHECSSLGGTASGVCAKGLGCCCIIKRTCGQSTKANCTYFSNPEYPDTFKGSGSPCTLNVWKCNSKVCQLRLDFLDFNLAEPDPSGHCLDDFLYVTGAGSNFPRICGLNTGQHAYVDFLGNGPIDITIDTNSALAVNRRWNIKVTQVKCCDRAPVGCLMSYTATSGKVMSFNYSPLPSSATPDPPANLVGTRELANLNYGVCVQMAPGYCSIEWSQSANDRFSFTVTGNATIADPDLGLPGGSVTGMNCTTDFIVIPDPSVMGMTVPYDRFCGIGLPTVTSSSKPFVLTVVTDDEENVEPDVANRGFCLNYRQLPCA